MRTHYRFLTCSILVLLSAFSVLAQPTQTANCTPVLAKDYYSYASKNQLSEDYVRSLDEQSYNEIKENNSFNLAALTQYGPFKVGDDYKTFNEKRDQYLLQENYH